MKRLIPFFFSICCIATLNAQSIPDFKLTDTQGNEHSMHETLARGQAVIIDFFATWCGPCQLSSVELNSFYHNNGAGSGNVQIFSITIEPSDDTEKIEEDNWGNIYPKFPFSSENMDIYNYYNNTLGLGTGGIPFFIYICPNVDDPGESEIMRSDNGYGSSMFNVSYQFALQNCSSASYVSVDELESVTAFSLFPNPTSEQLNINVSFDRMTTAEVLVHNTLGQLVKTMPMQNFQSGTHSLEFSTENMSNGMYFLTLNSEEGIQTASFSVVK